MEVVAAPDRRLFEVMTRPADGEAETLVGGPFVYRRTTIGWLQALFRELGRVWLVALGLVAAARLLAIPASVDAAAAARRAEPDGGRADGDAPGAGRR